MVGSSRSNKKSARSTRKRSSRENIPSIKNSFDVLEKEVEEIIRDTQDTKQRVRKFQQVWRKIFGRPVEGIAAEAYLQVKMKTTTRRKSQKGGSALAGAPLDYQTRPGIDGVHGSFPQYVSSGLGFYDTINQDQLNKGVGLSAFDPAVPADMGSNKVGGGAATDAAYLTLTRPFSAVSPPSITNDIQTTLQGRAVGPPADASINPLKYV
jgi:hypothetical protein